MTTLTIEEVRGIAITEIVDANITKVVINSNIGNSINKEMSYTGAELSGTEPNTNRVLTLPNTSISSSVTVFLDSAFMHPDVEITINNLATSSTITFLKEVWDSQKIWVTWNE